ncbi:unconventional myosin-XVIIIa-like [Lutzomyia longipalpis]|uniref:unconventional myosin-XVIIIa-like n=1 Tax=Lutzomyia longipalpis TaxID=7200 RepID=UPI002483DE8F|nr:unconventional myosin-XVIIIa-like [Lutzomyia longipalpis]
MAHQIDLKSLRQRTSWTKDDKILLCHEINNLRRRALAVEQFEENLEESLRRDHVQEMRLRVQKERQHLFNVQRLQNLRRFNIVKDLPAQISHNFERRELEVTTKMMQSAIYEIKYKRNMVTHRKNEMVKNYSNLQAELERLTSSERKIPQCLPEGNIYIELQNISTLHKAALYVNASYRTAINDLIQAAQSAKVKFRGLEKDGIEMQSITKEIEFSLKGNLQRLSSLRQEFEKRYMMEHNVEVYQKGHSELEDHHHHEKVGRKIEQKVQQAPEIPKSTQEIPQWDRQTIRDLKTRLEEVQPMIRSLQNATRCLELRGIEARFLRQLPDKEHFMAEVKRLREASVSLTEKRKEIAIQHDRYMGETDAEFCKNAERIDELKQKIAAERCRQLKYRDEFKMVSQQKIQLISSLKVLKQNLRKVGYPEDAGHEKSLHSDLDSNEGDDDSEEEDKLKDSDAEEYRLVDDVVIRCRILMKRYDCSMSEEEITKFEHLWQDKILEEITPSAGIEKSDLGSKRDKKNIKEIFDDMKGSRSDVPSRMDIKRFSDLIVWRNKIED